MIRKILTAAAIGLASVLGIAAPASAADLEWNIASGNPGPPVRDACAYWPGTGQYPGYGCFTANGDIFTLFDGAADGHSIGLYWRNYAADGSIYREGACVETRGVGTWGACNKNFIENSRLKIMVCTVESATKSKYDCANWSDWIYA